MTFKVVTNKGSVSMAPDGVTAKEKDAICEKIERTEPFPFSTAVAVEVEAFGRAIRDKKGHVKQAFEEAILDIRLVELLLRSGEEGGVVFTV